MAEPWQTTILTECHYAGASSPKEVGALIATEAGIHYTGKTRVSVGWKDLASFELLESQAPKGRQRSAFGMGAVGVAVVGATMAQNHRARKMVTRRFVRLTTTAGKKGEFTIDGDTSIAAAQVFAREAKAFIAAASSDS